MPVAVLAALAGLSSPGRAVAASPAVRTTNTPVVAVWGYDSAIVVDIVADDFVDPYGWGFGAYEVELIVSDPSVVQPVSIVNGPFLGSTGRAADCFAPEVLADRLKMHCVTYGWSPVGPVGDGVIATATFNALAMGSVSLSFGARTAMLAVDATPLTWTPAPGGIAVAQCADVNESGNVTTGDLSIVKRSVSTYEGGPNWEPLHDLNKDGLVTTGDLTLAKRQINRLCVIA